MDTIRRLEWKSVFDTVHGYLFRYHKAGDDRVRPSAGSDNTDLHAENSRAVIDTIYGNTVKWNQLYNSNIPTTTNRGVTFTKNSDGSYTVNGTATGGSAVAYITFPFTIDHFYYIPKKWESQGVPLTANNTNWSATVSGVFKVTSQTRFVIGVSNGVTVDNVKVYPIITDLTALDYPNIGTVTPTVAEVENWLALNVGKQDYYPYDAGSLISFGGTSLKSVGFNQWDEQWEYGAYDSETGEKKDMTQTAVRCKNKIKVIPSIIYYFAFLDDIQMANVRVGFYTKSGYFSITAIKNTTYQIPSDCNYIVFHYAPNSGERVPYDGGICINISDPSKNGIYKPYWENVLPIDPTKVYGKVNGAGEYVQCFPNGLNAVSKNSSGVDVDLKDTLSADTAVRRLGYKALKDVEVSLVTGATRFSLGDDRRYGSIAYFNAMLVSPRYTLALRGSSSGNQKDLTVQLNNSNTAIGYSYVKDSSEDFNIIRAALDQSYIVYELSDYITYTDLMYSEDGGVTGTPLSEFKYKVDKYSTEELIVPTSQTGAPTSTALNADIDYQYRG